MDWLGRVSSYVVGPLLNVGRLAPIAVIGMFSALIPITAGWRRRKLLPSPLRWSLIYLIATLAEELVMLYWSRSGRSNIWIINVYTPIGAIFLGLMFAGWQQRERWRTVIHVVTGIFPVFWGVMMLTVENIHQFPPYTQPVQALLVMAAAAWTLVQRTRHTVSPLTRHSWFWVSVGALFYFAYILLLDPFSSLMLSSSPRLVVVAFEINGVLVTLMNLFWLRAMLLVRIPPKAEMRT
jgi:hypothetical protein